MLCMLYVRVTPEQRETIKLATVDALQYETQPYTTHAGFEAFQQRGQHHMPVQEASLAVSLDEMLQR